MASVPPATSETSESSADGSATARPDRPTLARAGQLVPAWRVALTLCWVGGFLGFAAVWKASEEIGISTWWLGPRSEAQPLVVTLIPFAIAITAGLVAAYNLPRAVWVSLAASAAYTLVAAFDLPRSGGLALVELAIAASTALVAVGALSGRYRAVPPPDRVDGAGTPPAR